MANEQRSSNSQTLSDEAVRITSWILDSFRRWTGTDFVDRSGSPSEQAARVSSSPFAVLAHGTEADPRIMYANQTVLTLWELTIDEALGMPSRLTAEPLHRDERARLLERVTRDGIIDDYRGVRISKSGKRFWIENASVWNVVDDSGSHAGQAAMFANWTEI